MSDSFWKYGDARPQPVMLPPHLAKRPRSEFEMPSGHVSAYYAREGNMAGQRINQNTDTINASLGSYLRSTVPSYGGEAGRSMGSGFGGHYLAHDPRVITMGGSDSAVAAKSLSVGVGQHAGIPLPPDASNTLFVECLPANCTRREVSHIFRPFVGYKEVRLVTKEPRRAGGDPLVLCFVDFQSPAHAATAMGVLQGYKFDEHDRDSARLKLQFARYPVARSGGGRRGKR